MEEEVNKLLELHLSENAMLKKELSEKDDKIHILENTVKSFESRLINLEELKQSKYKCDNCEFEAKNDKGMEIHKRMKHEDKNDAIDENKEEGLNVSKDIKIETLPVIEMGKCNQCNFKSNTPKAFHGHMEKAHNISFQQTIRSLESSGQLGFKLKPPGRN